MTSPWLSAAPEIPTDEFPAGAMFEEIIVGAGITGLVSALLFARAGRRVAVLEARSVGAVTTGHSTAKISLLQGTQLSRVRSHGYPAIVQAYVDGNRDAFDWLVEYMTARDVDFEFRDAYSYAGTATGVGRIDREYTLARDAGLPVLRLPQAPLPFRTHAAIQLPDQAQVDPMRLLAALAADIRALGGVIVDNARVLKVRAMRPAVVHTSLGSLRADHVILATGVPILDRGLYFAKVSAQRSYAQSFAVPSGELPEGMFLNVEEPTRSIRTAGSSLLTGGYGHGVGREQSPRSKADELTQWTQAHFPGATLTQSWSAQDYSAAHHVPFVGWLPRGRGRIFLATGYDKWGMTNAVAAARTLVADIAGENTAWQKTLHHRITMPRAVATGIGENAAVAWWYARGLATAVTRRLPDTQPAEGHGAVGRRGLRPTAVSTVAGTTCAVSALCPHLGAVVTWNDAELSWDCPAHGSRFTASGRRLEGPALRDLSELPISSEG